MKINLVSRRQMLTWFFALGLLLTAVIIFMELAEDVWLKEGFKWDPVLMLAVHSLSRPLLDKIFWLVTQTAGPYIVIPVLLTVIWFWRRGEGKVAILLLVSYAGAMLMNVLLKFLFARPRPDLFPPLVVEHSYSFPSGHAMAAIAFYGLLALILWQRGHRLWAFLFGLWVPLVALSRVYLGAHYPSDVLASLALGTIWLVLVWFTFTGQHTSNKTTEPK